MNRLALSFLLHLLSSNLYSGERTGPEVFFSVSRAADYRSLAPADAETMDAASLEKAGADSIPALLEEASPLNIRRLNGPFGLATVSMRGFQSKQTAVYLDDIRVPADITGTVDLSVLPATGLGKVEILPGAASSIYGSGAEGGVVQLFTRRLTPGVRLAQAGAAFSAYNTRDYFAKAGAAGRAAEVFFAGSADVSDGFQQNSKIDKGAASGRASLELGAAGRLTVTGLFSRLKTGLPSGTPVPVGDWNGSREKKANSVTDWQTSRRGAVSASWSGGGGGLAYRVDSARSSNDIEAFQFGSLSSAKILDTSVSARLTLFKTVVLGAEGLASSLDSATYGGHSLNSSGFFAQETFKAAKGLEFTSGARVDRSGSYKSRVSPKLSAVYAPDEKWKFSAYGGYGFQAPTFADLYNPWAAPAPGLKPETSLNSGAAIYYGSSDGWYAGLSGYYSDIRDRIALDPVTWAAANLDSGFNAGLEAQAGYRLGGSDLSAGFVRNVSKVKTAGSAFELLNFSPKDRFTGSFTSALGGCDAAFTWRGVSEQYTGRGKTGLRLPEYWVFGLRVSRKYGPLEAWGGVSDLFDRHYAETADAYNGWFPQPGRVFSAGLKVSFL